MSFELTLDEGSYLVRLARHAIANYLEHGRLFPTPKDANEKFFQKCGVFVTLNEVRHGSERLRGCIGYPTPELPLIEATIDAAICSATKDPRFPPVEKDEMQNIIVEVSVLTPPSLINVKDSREYPGQIKVGKDGLIVENGFFRGLLLPQVPVEWEWDGEEFLSQCCIKAGLPPEAWVLQETKVFKFTCIIARETKPNGPVEIVEPSGYSKRRTKV